MRLGTVLTLTWEVVLNELGRFGSRDRKRGGCHHYFLPTLTSLSISCPAVNWLIKNDPRSILCSVSLSISWPFGTLPKVKGRLYDGTSRLEVGHSRRFLSFIAFSMALTSDLSADSIPKTGSCRRSALTVRIKIKIKLVRPFAFSRVALQRFGVMSKVKRTRQK